MFDCRFIFREQWLLRPRRPGRPGLRWARWWWWWCWRLVIGDWWLMMVMIRNGPLPHKQVFLPIDRSDLRVFSDWVFFWFGLIIWTIKGLGSMKQIRSVGIFLTQCSSKNLALLSPFTYFQLSQTPLKTWCGHIFNIWSHQVLKGV